MLTYLGAQKIVKNTEGSSANTFKFPSGTIYSSPAGTYSIPTNEVGSVGSISPDVYNSTKCFFTSRGCTAVVAETMTSITADMAELLGISVQSLLEQVDKNGKFQYSDDAYRAFNILRDPGNQVSTTKAALNSNSIVSRQIRT